MREVDMLENAGLAVIDGNIAAFGSSQYVEEAFCSENTIDAEGKVVTQGDKDFLLNDPVARKVYLGETFQM